MRHCDTEDCYACTSAHPNCIGSARIHSTDKKQLNSVIPNLDTVKPHHTTTLLIRWPRYCDLLFVAPTAYFRFESLINTTKVSWPHSGPINGLPLYFKFPSISKWCLVPLVLPHFLSHFQIVCINIQNFSTRKSSQFLREIWDIHTVFHTPEVFFQLILAMVLEHKVFTVLSYKHKASI